MFSQRRRVAHRLLAAVLSIVALASVVGPAQAAPKAGRTSYAKAIEPLAAYEPQTTCSPTAKRGTADLSRRLLKAYPRTRSLGIVRACGAGGRSEHKEGRAFDWGVNVKNARDRAAVNNFTKWLLATDRHGNRYAMARRLGIQYVIWNKRIWGSYAAGGGWRPYSGASPHTDHVHISFTRAGADGRTSFWTKRPAYVKAAPVYVAPPKNTKPALRQPAPAARLHAGPELEYEVVSLNAKSPAGVTTRSALVAGETYLIEAQGGWAYTQKDGSLADAECSRSPKDGVWRRDRSVHPMDVTSDHLDLYVDGVDLLATPDVDTGHQCDEKTHTYRWEYTPTRSGRVPLQLWDPGTYKDNGGSLVISIMHSVAKAEMAFSIPSQGNAGVMSPGALEAGATYIGTVGGTYDAGGGVTADAACAARGGGWTSGHNLGLVVDGRGMRTEPWIRDAAGCNSSNHFYRFVLQPRSTRPVNMRVADPHRADNIGALEVRLVKVGQVTGPENVALNTTVSTGVSTERNYPAGQPLLVTVGGTYTMGPGLTADAECTSLATDPAWRTWRANLVDAHGSGLGDVTVNGRGRDWEPMGTWSGCELTHTYTTTVTPSQAGPLSFSIIDTDFSDNAGVLYLTVEPGGARPALPAVVAEPNGPPALLGGPALEDETVRVNAAAPGGALTAGSFTAGETYLIEASGSYQYANSPDAFADAECSRSPNDATWRRDRSIHRGDGGSDHLDLYIDGVDLLADADTNTGEHCDLASHTYRWAFTPTRTGRMSLQLWDPATYADNIGGLDVRVIRYADKDELVWNVAANAAAGVSSPGALQAGSTYVVTVSGTYDAGAGVTADAECSAVSGQPWQLDRSVLPAQPGADHLDLLVDRKDVAGKPVSPSPDVAGCDIAGHSYRFVLKPSVTRPINLRVYDPSPGDNSGQLAVRVAKVVPVVGAETMSLDTTSANGATSVRNYEYGKPLLLTVSGTYSFGGGVTADAECTATATDPVWRTYRSDLVDTNGRGLGDVTVNGSIPDWRRGGSGGCDTSAHRYTLRYTPWVAGPIVLSLADTNFADNMGTLTLSIEPVG